tara:strand:- start:112 stop:447 length:336 start_codon:yes stop_codon:yes gene_type:complete
MTPMNNTLSYTVRLNERYNQIDDVVTHTPLWLILTDAMLAKYNNAQLNEFGQGQTSKLNSLQNQVMNTFADSISVLKGINQRIDDTNDVDLLVVDNTKAEEVRQYVQTLQF